MYREVTVYLFLSALFTGVMQKAKFCSQKLANEVRSLEVELEERRDKFKLLRREYDALSHIQRLQPMITRLKMKPMEPSSGAAQGNS